ncbi:MAG: hypothetical protein WAT39_19370 [Planctomycetota bacterium]
MGAGLLAALFLACRQERLHPVDPGTFIELLQNGEYAQYDRHVAFLPLVAAVMWLFGTGAYQAMVLTTAVGSATGCFFLHRAARRLVRPAPDAMLVVLAVALTPAVLYYATAVEIHGVFFAGAGAAWWAFARWHDRPGPAAAALLGAMCGLAATLHSYGALLPPTFAGTAWALRCWPRRNLLGQALAGTAGFVAAAAFVAWPLRGDAAAQAGAAAQFLGDWIIGIAIADFPRLLASEWLLPFAPWSLLALGALGPARSRPWAMACLAGLAVHLPVTMLLLSRGTGVSESGAYHLSLAVPAVLAAGAWLSRRAFVVALVASALIGSVWLAPRLRSAYSPQFVAGLAELQQERKFTLLASTGELEGVRKHFSGIPCFDALEHLQVFSGSAQCRNGTVTLARWFDACANIVEAAGAPWLITDAACEALAGSVRADVRSLVSEHVLRNYRQEPVHRAGLHGLLLKKQ